MSITSVHSQINKAVRDFHVTDAEMKKIIAATAPKVSNGEAKAVADLYDRVTAHPPAAPGAVFARTVIDGPALNRLNTFIAAKNLPIGNNQAAIKVAINAQLATVRLNGAGVAKPRGLSRLMNLQLSPLSTSPGATNMSACVNVATKQFYLVTNKAILNGTRYYGPFDLPATQPVQNVVSDAKLADMRKAFNAATNLAYTPGGVAMNHLGVRLAAVPLFTEKHPDGFSYTAYLPLGALTPTAPQMNPERVTQMYIERTGGFAGFTESAGPISI